MAATTAIAGYDGSFSGPTGISEVINWNVDVTTEELDATSMSSGGWREFIEGLKGASGTASVQGTAIPARGLSAATLKTKSTGGATITGSVLVNRVGIGVPVDGKVTYDVAFSFTGSVGIS